MRIYDIIEKKKNGGILSPEMIDYFVRGTTNGSIPDHQISALLMAICINGMDKNETYELTMAIASSGIMNDLSELGDNVVDKHSSGGVGDKCTLIIGPITASLGIPFAKLSGKGLGHTGGTIDKLDSIKGFRTDLGRDSFIKQVKGAGIAISSQTGELAPADKRIYAIRDVTATVDSIPLIAASIMGKKIASGAGNILLDVKCGSGAFMKDPSRAFELAEAMIDIGVKAGRKVSAYITDMDQPLGYKIGNTLEIEEVCDTLNGKGPSDLTELCTALTEGMLKLAGYEPVKSYEADIFDTIKTGKAYDKFKELVLLQGGSIGEDGYPVMVSHGSFQYDITARRGGFISGIDATGIGKAALELGAGRISQDDTIDYSAGITMKKKTGDHVEKGEPVASLIYNSAGSLNEAAEIASGSFTITNKKPDVRDLVIRIYESGRIW